jgi:DNA-binding NtrC family response regulator
MPASVVIVHDDPVFLDTAAAALRNAGHEVATFDDPMTALSELEAATSVEVLVTRVTFPAGTPNGVSLALVAKAKRPYLNVVFAAKAERQTLTEGIGELIPHPVDLTKLVARVTRLIDERRRSTPQREA